MFAGVSYAAIQEMFLLLTPAERAELLGLIGTYRSFQITYRNDRVGFANDCILWPTGRGLAFYQSEILGYVDTHKRVAVRGPHGLGKTAMMAILILHFVLTRDGWGDLDWKAPTTAGAWRQLTKYLWPEIHKWARRLKWQKIGRKPFDHGRELLDLSIKGRSGEAYGVASDKPDLIEGAHANSMMYFFDESKAIADATFNAAEGAFSTAGSDTDDEAFAVAFSTPGPTHGRFYDIHRRAAGFEDWKTVHVTVDMAIKAGRVSSEWVEKCRKLWGEKSAVFQNRVLGEFAAESKDTVIPLAWIEISNQRWLEWKDKHGEDPGEKIDAYGVDIGGDSIGSDLTVIAMRQGHITPAIRKYRQDTMETVGVVAGLIDRYGGVALPDIIGMGAGVYHRLRELRKAVLPFNASSGTDATDRSGELGFVNMRSAAWWNMRERLDPDSPDPPVLIPPDDDLTAELTTPTWKVTSTSKIQVESKEDIKKRLEGRSTDTADAVIQSYADRLVKEARHDDDDWEIF